MKIIINYKFQIKLPNLKFEHGEEQQYSKPRLHNIIDTVLSVGYELTLIPDNDNIIVIISDLAVDESYYVINNIDEFKQFISDYSNEILINVHGMCDGWNQKINYITKILDDNKIKVADIVYDHEEFEEIINNI